MVAAPGMDGTATAGANFPFLPLAAGRRGLLLRCLRRFEAGAPLLLFCGGVEVGRLAPAEAVEPGRTVEVPVLRLPRVALPAELRLATDVAGPDLSPPWEIASADAAFALLGPPAPVLESLRLDHGVLRGVATEKANGLLEPLLYARVNGAAARAVAVEAPAPLAEGGCVFRFAVPLQPADLVEAGLSVDVHMVGLEAPVARFALAPALDPDAAGRAAAELEGRLRRLEDAMASGLDAMEHALRRRMDAHGERVDAFIEACASLLLDRVAAGDAPATLRALVGGGAADAPEAAPLRLGNRVELPPDSGHLGFGWHAPEKDAAGAFRWMADRALVVSPEPHRPLAAVTLEVGHLYGAAEPALRASFDALPCDVSAERDGDDGRRFRVRLAPAGGAAAPCRTLMLEALASGSPARDGASPDARLLSVAVYRLVFDYAD